ncbi:unnamed protein product, partial [Gulo gulo]
PLTYRQTSQQVSQDNKSGSILESPTHLHTAGFKPSLHHLFSHKSGTVFPASHNFCLD